MHEFIEWFPGVDEKGRVERLIRFVRDSFFGARRFRDLDDLNDLNDQADEWCSTRAVISHFVSWDHREYLSEYSVDGLPGMTEQSGSRSSRPTQRRSTSCASPGRSKLLRQTMPLNTQATPGRRAIPRLLRPRSCPRVLAAPRPSVPGSLR